MAQLEDDSTRTRTKKEEGKATEDGFMWTGSFVNEKHDASMQQCATEKGRALRGLDGCETEGRERRVAAFPLRSTQKEGRTAVGFNVVEGYELHSDRK